MPIVRPPLDPRISMWHFLAYFPRFWREKEGLSLAQCGQIINVTRSTVCNIEAGRQRPHDDQMKKLDLRYGTGVLFRMLLWYARMAHDPDWGRQLHEYEKQANSIRIYHGQVVPLPLQTDEYAWAYVRAGTSKDFEAVMERRTARRRDLLERGDSVDLWVVLDESVLARTVGGPEAMRDQLDHLLAMAELPHVILRVVSFSSGEHLGVDGSLQILGLEDRDVVYAGAQNGGRLVEGPIEARELSVKYDRIDAKAASQEASRALIRHYRERYT